MQVATNVLVYEKSLRIPTARPAEYSLGKVQNLMSADATRMYTLAYSVVAVLVAPLQIIGLFTLPSLCRAIMCSPRLLMLLSPRAAAVGLLIRVLGATALVGLGVMIVFLPPNAWVGAKVFGACLSVFCFCLSLFC